MYACFMHTVRATQKPIGKRMSNALSLSFLYCAIYTQIYLARAAHTHAFRTRNFFGSEYLNTSAEIPSEAGAGATTEGEELAEGA